MPMIESDRPDYTTLRWVKEGIDESLHIARQGLEEYIAAGYSGDGIQQYVTQLHQVLGMLRMVQVYGAGMLVEEMEHIGLALANGELSPFEGLMETQMLGLLQLPSYLQRVQNGAPDIPLVLLPIINDLRSARNANPASEISIYAPNLEQLIEREPVIPNSGNPDIGELVRRQRIRYHKGLLEWYRDENSDHGLHAVLDLVRQVNAAAGTLRLRSLMDAAEALTLILIGGEFSASGEVKRLYSRLDRIFKRLIDLGEESTVKDFPRELYKNLLYFVARSGSNDPVVNSVRKSADLANSFTSKAKADTGGVDQDVLDAVKDVILTDLNGIKETFDLYIRGDHEETGCLIGLADHIDQLRDTLGVIGRGALRNQLQSCSTEIRDIESHRASMSDESLMQLATDLLSVETALSNPQQASQLTDDTVAIVDGADEHGRNLEAIIREAFTEVSRIKNQLEAYLLQAEHKSDLDQMFVDLVKLAGVFNVVGMSAVSELLTEVTPQLQQLNETDLANLSPARREAIVDLFAGLDYYLETRLMHGSGLDNILDYSWQALRRFTDEGVLSEEATTFFAPPEKPVASDSELISDSGAISADETVPAMELGSNAEADAEMELDDLFLSASVEDVEEIDIQPVEEPDIQLLADEEEQDVQIFEESEVVYKDEAPVETVAASLQADEIDPEIFEIFMEEAWDVLAVIQENYPRWRENQNDAEALQDFRRSFHTLKGSGRMVGAHTIGEFAWSIENLLNGLLDGKVQANDDFLGLMDDAVVVLPQLIQGQAEGNMPDVNLAAMEERAFALAEGRALKEARVTAPDEQQMPADLVVETPVLERGAEPEPAILMEDDLYEIFSIESATHLATIEGYLGDDTGKAVEVSDDLIRAIHTLRGSSHLAEVDAMASVADEMEMYSNHLRQLNRPIEGDGLSALRDFHQFMQQMLGSINVVGKELPNWQSFKAELARLNSELPEVISPLQESAGKAELSAQQPAIDSEMLDLFLEEAAELTEQLEQSFVGWSEDSAQQASDSLKRSLHTLKGSARLAGIESLGNLVHALESLVEQVVAQNSELTADISDMIRSALDQIENTLDMLHLRSPLPDLSILTQQLEAMSNTLAGVREPVAEVAPSALQQAIDPEMLDLFLEEATELTEQLGLSFVDWSEDSAQQQASDSLKRSLHTLKGGARLAGVESLGNLIHALESLIEQVVAQNSELTADISDMIRSALDQIENTLDMLHLRSPLPDLSTLTQQLEAMSETLAEYAPPESLLMEDERNVPEEEPEPESVLLPEHWAGEAESIELPAFSESVVDAGDTAQQLPDVDLELLEIFLEEAGELSEKLEHAYAEWAEDIRSKEAIDGLMRSLHTLKGNARFAQLFDLGDLSHALESLFENIAADQLQAESRLIPLVRVAMDKLELSIDHLQQHQPLPALSNIVTAVNAAAIGQAWELPTETSIFAPVDADLPQAEVVPFPVPEHIDSTRPHERPPPMQAEATRRGKNERVRVRSQLLGQLVNHAGEVSIYRARLEQQNNTVGRNLDELTETVRRLQKQLRSLELETEAQVLSRYERDRETGQYEEFDPLEMDRYSTMQQLSRALSETVGDLSDIGETLHNLTRDTDTLLLQQARVTNDLQDGLLRTRMVPFSRQATRLQRVVRQTSQTLGKQADLIVQGTEGEIDRNILNRMMGPLEHLLRNAVAHGIETPAKRLKLGKPKQGKVTLMLAREGTEIVITLSDDGRGLDPDRIRKTAIERGLLEPEAEVSDEALYQFILAPGFTTAKEATQVAGRGVGMDAVLSELKQLGGTLEIDSYKGRGSSFIIRLPFTLAISDALLVKAAGEVFAIPHGNAEQIIRATRQDLMACYSGKVSGINYGGHEYPVRYLGAMLGMAEPELPSTTKWYPILLVRSGEERMAIHLDHLLGNYQIVVKSIGGQLSGVRWFTGGTILADGDIALLLDLNALVRSDIAHRPQIAQTEKKEESVVTVMVVDDSITVRKVTSNLLERHHMKVVTAKDGVDAVTVLQNTVPDVMLLDIEMPRMDGYELARHIRNTPELEHLPIIMITSRTGEKHRERGMELGVNQYLGKPFQEAELLDNIHTLLADHANE